MDPVQEGLFRELSRRLASGHSTEQIAREVDYQQSFLEQLLARDEFLDFFKEEFPKEFAVWRRAREEEEADLEVKSFLQSKALHNIKKLQKLVDEGQLRAPDEAKIRTDLVKMSGLVKQDNVVELVKISAPHLAALREKALEVDSVN